MRRWNSSARTRAGHHGIRDLFASLWKRFQTETGVETGPGSSLIAMVVVVAVVVVSSERTETDR